MGVFYHITGVLLVTIFTFIQVKISQSKDKFVASAYCHKFPGVAFFQLLGLFWILLGLIFTAKIITYPKGGWGILLTSVRDKQNETSKTLHFGLCKRFSVK